MLLNFCQWWTLKSKFLLPQHTTPSSAYSTLFTVVIDLNLDFSCNEQVACGLECKEKYIPMW